MGIVGLNNLKILPWLIIIESSIGVLLSLSIYLFSNFFIKEVKCIKANLYRMLELSLSIINDISKVVLLFSLGIFFLGLVMLFSISIFTFSMNLLYAISIENGVKANQIFSTLASPLATTLSICFTILFAIFGNKILSMETIKQWIRKIVKKVNALGDAFITSYEKTAVFLTLFTPFFILKRFIRLSWLTMFICWITTFLIIIGITKFINHKIKEKVQEKKEKIKQLDKILRYIIFNKSLISYSDKHIKK